MEHKRRILVAPLDWGLGHATRCIPVIRALLKRNATVIIAGSGSSAELLKQEFPHLSHYSLPGYNPRYPANGNMVLSMAAQLPRFIKTIYREHAAVNNLVKKENIDVIIADNRYGCYSSKAYSVFITHQLTILMPPGFKRMEPIVNRFNARQISRFNACWVPAPDPVLLNNLLPRQLPAHARFVGYLSRFNAQKTETKYDVVAIASGPDPQRKMLVNMLRAQLKEAPLDVYLVQGQPRGNEKIYPYNNFTEANHLGAEKLNTVMAQAGIIIARSGYSTIMDLIALGKKAIFIPTPGQTEQQYLAAQLMEQGIAFSMEQHNFNFRQAIKESDKFGGFTKFGYDETLLDQAIQSIL